MMTARSPDGGERRHGEGARGLRKRGLAAAAKKAGRTASEGVIGTYIHPGAKIGVMVEVNCETDFVARTPEFQSLVKDVAMHVAAASPQYVTKEEVPAQVLEKEKEIYKSQPRPRQSRRREGQDRGGQAEACLLSFVLLEQPFRQGHPAHRRPARRVEDRTLMRTSWSAASPVSVGEEK